MTDSQKYLSDWIKRTVRDVPDFPKKGIVFKDIAPLLANAGISKAIVIELAEYVKELKVDAITGMESRGFLYGQALAIELGIPFIPVRKAGKLPFHKIQKEYQLEYGTAVIEMHTDSVTPGMRVLIHDDLLATGGTAKAAAELIQEMGGEVAGFAFVIGLPDLPGKQLLQEITDNIIVLAEY